MFDPKLVIICNRVMICVYGENMRVRGNGFTLIELMVTIAVLAIIAMMAAPSFGTMTNKQNLNKSSRELVAVLTQARAKAALERRLVTVQLNSNASDIPGQLNWAPSGKANLKTAPASIVFLPNGLIQNAIGDTAFIICDNATDPKYSKTISISRMGTIQSPAEGNCQ